MKNGDLYNLNFALCVVTIYIWNIFLSLSPSLPPPLPETKSCTVQADQELFVDQELVLNCLCLSSGEVKSRCHHALLFPQLLRGGFKPNRSWDSNVLVALLIVETEHQTDNWGRVYVGFQFGSTVSHQTWYVAQVKSWSSYLCLPSAGILDWYGFNLTGSWPSKDPTCLHFPPSADSLSLFIAYVITAVFVCF